jgi:hypothetical protein
LAILLWLLPASAYAMGEVPGDENLCKTILSSLQSQQPLPAEAVAFAEEYRGRALQRQAAMEQNLDVIDGDLQIGGSWGPQQLGDGLPARARRLAGAALGRAQPG